MWVFMWSLMSADGIKVSYPSLSSASLAASLLSFDYMSSFYIFYICCLFSSMSRSWLSRVDGVLPDFACYSMFRIYSDTFLLPIYYDLKINGEYARLNLTFGVLMTKSLSKLYSALLSKASYESGWDWSTYMHWLIELRTMLSNGVTLKSSLL